jgi:hypothetical protein
VQTGFTAKYWNLAMAAAWVKFRKREVVEKFDGPSPESWWAYNIYDSMWEFEPVDVSLSLQSALISGNLKAYGHRSAPGATMETIPSLEWETLILDPPAGHRCLANNVKDEPWVNIRVETSDVQKLWRVRTETEGRSRFDWTAIRELYETVIQYNPDMSKNEIIAEVQQEFLNRFSKNPPSRTSLQNKVKTWR